jgi:hypothetical protein
MPEGRKEAIFSDAGKRYNTCVYQELLRQHVVPWVQRMYPNGKYVFQPIQPQLTPPRPHSSSWRNCDLGGFDAIFGRLELAGLRYLEHSAGASLDDNFRQYGRPVSIHHCGMETASGGTHPLNLPLIPPQHGGRHGKNSADIE